MDPYHGFEVGAEVELNDGPAVLEDSAAVIVENKQDLPSWHHFHFVDESSSDESLDHQHVSSTSSKNMKAPKYVPEVKTLTERSDQLESKMFFASESLYTEPSLQAADQSVVWSDEYHGDHRDQTCPLGSGLKETEISHLEMVPALNYSPSPTQSSELYSESILTKEGDEAELLGKYSFYNARTQCAGTVKPWVRSHKCTKCGRQFGRMYNLESHMCIKTALTRVNMDDIMSGHMSDINSLGTKCEQSEESMIRLEKMCAEAQKELQNLQELYRKEEEKPLLGLSVESLSESTHVDGLVPDKILKYKHPFSCDRCGRRFKRRFNLGFHVCCSDRNMSAPQNTIVIKPDNSVVTDVLTPADQPSSGQDVSPKSENEILDRTSKENVFRCQYCGKVYNRRASYGTHMRWHMKENDLVSSVNKSLATGDLGSLLSTINMTSLGLKKKAGPTFTCQECGRVFNKQCSYSTHALWHIKRRNSGSALAVPSVSQVMEGQEIRTSEVPILSIPAKCPGSDGTKTSPNNTFTCQECGRVFSKRTAYANHTRWHIKERELELSFKAATQTVGDTKAMGHQLNSSSTWGSSQALPISSLEVDDFQGYCNLVEHLNLGDQENHYIDEAVTENRSETVDNPLEADRQSTPTEVPEFVFEMVVGTESFFEGLTSKAVEASETAGDAEETTLRTQTKSLTSNSKDRNERPLPLSLFLPYELLNRVLKRPRPPHRCRDCGVCFSQSWKLKFHQHKSTMRRSRWKKHRCDCGRSPVGLLHFLRHQLQHLSNTAFICAVCGKLLRGCQQLQVHSWVHSLVSPFQCKCGAQFTQLPRYLWHSLLNKTKERRSHKPKRQPKT